MDFVKIVSQKEIFQTLKNFNYCFPHLEEKINDLEEYANKLFRYSEFYVAKNENTITGMISFYCNDSVGFKGYISLIGVHSDCQKMGIGKFLIHSAADIMREHGMRYLRIEVDTDNKNAQAFYMHLGFVKAESKEDSFYMEKSL